MKRRLYRLLFHGFDWVAYGVFEASCWLGGYLDKAAFWFAVESGALVPNENCKGPEDPLWIDAPE